MSNSLNPLNIHRRFKRFLSLLYKQECYQIESEGTKTGQDERRLIDSPNSTGRTQDNYFCFLKASQCDKLLQEQQLIQEINTHPVLNKTFLFFN